MRRLTGHPARARAQALRPRPAWLAAVAIAAICVLAYWPTLGYGFIQDDWVYLRYKAFSPHPDGLRFVADAFTRVDGLFYRPVWEVYSTVVYRAAGLAPLAFQAVALAFHVAASLLVVAAAARVAGSKLVGWVAGSLYAGAVVAAVQPLLWLTGSLDLLAALLALAAFVLYASERHALAAIALVAAVLSKESALPFVAILPAYHWLCGGESIRAGRLRRARFAWPLLVGAAVLAFGSARLGDFLAKPAGHPYHLSVSPGDLGESAAAYLGWLGRAVVPSADFGLDTAMPPRFTAAELAGFAAAVLALLGLAYLAGRSLRRRDTPGVATWSLDRRRAAFLVLWVALALLPALVLPNHRFAFYALPALPGFVTLAAWLLAGALARASRDPRAAAGAFLVAVALILGAGAAQLWRYERAVGDWTTRQLLRRGLEPFVLGQVEARVERGLRDRYASLPYAAALVFEDVDAAATHGEGAPQVWYHDRSLVAYEALRHGVDAGGLWIVPPSATFGAQGSSADEGEKLYLDRPAAFLVQPDPADPHAVSVVPLRPAGP